MKKNSVSFWQKGVIPIVILIIVPLLLLVGGGVYYLKSGIPKPPFSPSPVITGSQILSPEVTEPQVSPRSSQLSGKIKIIDGNICLVGQDEEVKILIDKNNWQAITLDYFSDVMVSPDGQKLCFLGHTIQPTWLFWSKIDGSNVVKVNALAKNCVWSQNSQKIAFNNETSDVSPIDVYVYDIQTEQVKNLTQPVNQNETVFRIYQQPEWSEGDTKIISKYTLFPAQTRGVSVINTSTYQIEDN